MVTVHLDYSHKGSLVPAIAGMMASGVNDMVPGSRILVGGTLKGGMPGYNYFSNHILTAFHDITPGFKIPENHSGFRVFSRGLSETLPILENSNDLVFERQKIAQPEMFGFRIGEVFCPINYFAEARSLNSKRRTEYGFGVLTATASFVAHKWGVRGPPRFDASGKKVMQQYYSELANHP